MKKNTIIDNIVFIVLCLFAISVIFLQKHLNILFTISGIVLLIIGILYALMKKKISSLIIGIGFSIIVTSYLFNKEILSFGTSVMFFLSFSLDIIIFLTLIVMSVSRSLLNKEYPLKIKAVVVDLVRNKETKKEFYMPVYKYTYKTIDYEVDAGGYIDKDIPNIGDSKDILVSKKDPANVFILPSKKQVFLNYFGLCFLLVVVTLVVISLFR